MLENGTFMTDKLRAFLNADDILGTYEKSVRTSISNGSNMRGSQDEYDIIGTAFSWARTPQGRSWWGDVQRKWRRSLDE